MSEPIYRPYFFCSQTWQTSTPVNWWVDEGTRVTVDGERMVRFRDTLTLEAHGGWFTSRTAALAHVANEVRRYADALLRKAEEIESE